MRSNVSIFMYMSHVYRSFLFYDFFLLFFAIGKREPFKVFFFFVALSIFLVMFFQIPFVPVCLSICPSLSHIFNAHACSCIILSFIPSLMFAHFLSFSSFQQVYINYSLRSYDRFSLIHSFAQEKINDKIFCVNIEINPLRLLFTFTSFISLCDPYTLLIKSTVKWIIKWDY